jgi:spermidine synthase
MNQESQRNPASFLPWLLILFAGSGFCALIYEIVWFQMLQLAIGSTSVSLGILLATFMGGLCIGSLRYPRITKYLSRHPLRMYGMIEIGIAISAILVLFLVPLVDRVYIAGAASGLPGMVLRAIFCAICLLPPTILMGASLPAISRWIEATPRGATWWGLLYGFNTVGAVFGCLFAGFVLLRLYDVRIATLFAASINVLVALVSFSVASKMPDKATPEDDGAVPAAADQVEPEEEPAFPVYLTIGLSGMCALAAQVIWTRLLGALLGLTVYAFAIILAVFLIGLAIGSGVGSMIARSVKPRLALGWAQLLACLGIAWSSYMIAKSLPYWPINPMLARSPWDTMQLDFVRVIWAVLPAPLLWGASFPLALAAVASRKKDAGRTVGGIYAANTLGTIIGALGTSLFMVPWLGTQDTQKVILIVSAISSLFLIVPYIQKTKSLTAMGVLTASLAFAAFLATGIPAVTGGFIMWGRQLMTLGDESKIVYSKEGRNSSVAIAKFDDGTISIGVNGHVEASSLNFDMKLQRMVGHLPAILHPNPKKVLGIGFGAGVSAGTFTRYPGIESITVCEIEPIIPPTSTRFFAAQNYEVYNNPKTRVIFDDARHYLMTTTDKYDIIASDPLDVFAKGTAALYTVEYFQAVKRHLNPGGYFTLYVPLYESDFDTVKSELATFFEAFPNATVWQNTINGRGYDMVFMGQNEPFKVNLDEVYARLARPDYAPVMDSLRDLGFFEPMQLFSTYGGAKPDLGEWVKGAALNNDRDLKLQYMAGWGINSQAENEIYIDMMKFRKMPKDMFFGSPERVSALLAAIRTGPQ